MVSIKKQRAMEVNPLKTGEHSARYIEFLKRNNLLIDKPVYDENNYLDYLKKMVAYTEARKRQNEILMDYYKSLGNRGVTLMEELVELDSQISMRQGRLISEGKDVLEDEVLQQAYKRRFEIIKFLEKMEFDKERFEVESKVKKISASDDLFIITKNEGEEK